MIDKLLRLSSKLSSTKASASPLTSSSTESTTLSLKQLIQVHESLLDSFFDLCPKNNVPSSSSSLLKQDLVCSKDLQDILQSSNYDHDEKVSDNQKGKEANYDDNDDTKKKLLLEKMLNAFIPKENKEEIEICISTLLNNNKSNGDDISSQQHEEKQILMVVQYILRLSCCIQKEQDEASLSSSNSLFFNIKNITYPILFLTNFSNELRHAILDATFSSSKEEDTKFCNTVTDVSLLSSCLDLIQESITALLHTTIHDSRRIANNRRRRKESKSTTTTQT